MARSKPEALKAVVTTAGLSPNGAAASIDEQSRPEREYPTAADLEKIPECNLDLLRTCASVLARQRGCFTPAETFIEDLLLNYQISGGLTPESVNYKVARFHEDFADMCSVSAQFVQAYPAHVSAGGREHNAA